QGLAVGREGRGDDQPVVAVQPPRVLAAGVPEPDGAVVAEGRQGLAVGGVEDADGAGVAGERAGLALPRPRRVRGRARGEQGHGGECEGGRSSACGHGGVLLTSGGGRPTCPENRRRRSAANVVITGRYTRVRCVTGLGGCGTWLATGGVTRSHSTVGTAFTAFSMTPIRRSNSFRSASGSRRTNRSTAAKSATMSSLPTFIARPMVPQCGLVFAFAASTSS